MIEETYMCTDVESIQTHCNCSLTFKVVVTTVYSALVFLFISFIVSKNRYICKTVFDYKIIHTYISTSITLSIYIIFICNAWPKLDLLSLI